MTSKEFETVMALIKSARPIPGDDDTAGDDVRRGIGVAIARAFSTGLQRPRHGVQS
jgi:hypothetical protein